MGILVARHYPTKLMPLGLADHTYVECAGGGRQWRCFGGTTGGSLLRSGAGSTSRADRISQPNDQAGLKCYAVNGVCHQAANRILFPAGVLVRGARGYKLSEAIYGPFGRPRGPFCASPFYQHAGVTGDLPACMVAAMHSATVGDFAPEWRHIEGAMQIYAKHGALESMSLDGHALVDLQVELFMHLANRELASWSKADLGKLPYVRADNEKQRVEIEDAFFDGKIRTSQFVGALTELDHRFQKELAGTLAEREYQALLGAFPGDLISLVDPEIAQQAYGEGPLR